MKNYAWILLYLLTATDLFAGDSTIVSFSIGNRYAFGGSLLDEGCGCPDYISVTYSEKIIADTIINEHKYSIFSRSPDIPRTYVYSNDTGIVFYR